MRLRGADGSYLKNIATLMSGSMIGQLFTLICAPILTRLCSTDDLGVYALVAGAITLFGSVMSLRYDVCIVSEHSDEKALALIKLSLYLCIGLSLFISLGYIVYFSVFDTGANAVVLGIITGLLVLLMGIINVLTAYNNRLKDYALITKTYTLRTVAQNLCNLVAGFLGLGPIGLSFSHLIGYCAGVKGQIKPLRKREKELISVTKEEMGAVAVENSKQATLSTPATLANGLSYSLVNYFIAALFSMSTVGYYSLSYRILGLPITIISANASRVFLERASEEYCQKGNFVSTYQSTVFILAAMGVPIGAFLILFAPAICEFAFGPGWSTAGVYIRILTPMFILRFIAGGVNCSAIIANRQHIDLLVQVLLTITVVTLFVISLIMPMEVTSFLRLLNVSFSAIYVLYIYLFWRCAKN